MKYSQKTIEHFIFEEGLRLTSYKDTEGYWTIGVGHMLGKDQRYANISISRERCIELLESDIDGAYDTCEKLIDDYDNRPNNVRLAMLDMAFNLGYNNLSKFVQTLHYVNSGQYKMAASQALKSKWATQVPNRAKRVAKLLETA